MSYPDANLDMYVDYDFESYVDVDFDTKNTYDSHVEITECISWNPYIEDNSVVFNVDAQAFGDETLVDVSIVALALDNEYSSFTATGVVIAQ